MCIVYASRLQGVMYLSLTAIWLNERDSDSDLALDGFGTLLRLDRDSSIPDNLREWCVLV